jgi:anti-sigma B factor antagonist
MSEEAAEIRLETRTVQEVLVIKVLDSRIRYEQSESFVEQVEKVLDIYHPSRVVLDLQEVQYVTSHVLGKIVGLHKSMKTNQQELKLVVTSKTVLSVFKITSLDKLLSIYAGIHEALNAF